VGRYDQRRQPLRGSRLEPADVGDVRRRDEEQRVEPAVGERLDDAGPPIGRRDGCQPSFALASASFLECVVPTGATIRRGRVSDAADAAISAAADALSPGFADDRGVRQDTPVKGAVA